MIESAQPLVEVVIPNWNGCEMLETCLASLAKQTFTNFSITVVDNGSTDKSLSFIQEHYPDVKVIEFPENRGFSVAVNQGIQEATAPWIFLLNNDIEVESDCLQQIATFVQNNTEYDCLAVKMLNFHHRQYLDGAGDAVLRGGAGYRLGTMEQDSEQYSTSREIFGACAGAAVYSQRFFEITGFFDNDFFAYLEDVDLSFRARRRGLRSYYLAEAAVYHIGSATTGSKINSFTIKQSTKNSFHVLTKNYPVQLWLRFLPVILVYQFIWFLFTMKKGQVLSYCIGLGRALTETPGMIRKGCENSRFPENISISDFARQLKESENEVIESIMSRRSSAGKGNGLLKIYQSLFL